MSCTHSTTSTVIPKTDRTVESDDVSQPPVGARWDPAADVTIRSCF